MFMRLPRAGLIRTLAAMGARAVIAHARASFPTWALLACRTSAIGPAPELSREWSGRAFAKCLSLKFEFRGSDLPRPQEVPGGSLV